MPEKKVKEQIKKQQINHSNIDYKGNIPLDFYRKEYLELVIRDFSDSVSLGGE